jgi:hypothetical protein
MANVIQIGVTVALVAIVFPMVDASPLQARRGELRFEIAGGSTSACAE